MDLAKAYERTANEFFLQVRHLLRSGPAASDVDSFAKWSQVELDLNQKLEATKKKVHMAFCDNIDTRSVLEALRDLIRESNSYITVSRTAGDKEAATAPKLNRHLLRCVALYITRIFDILGMVGRDGAVLGFPSAAAAGGAASGQEVDMETLVLPYLTAMADFRDNVRRSAMSVKATEILRECDRLRDDVLPNLGVRLEDKENEPTVIKLVDREELMKEREEKRAAEEKKRKEKEARKAEAAAKAEALEAAKRIPPSTMFLGETDKYSKWDEKGMPTHTKDGEEIPKAQLKKLQKLYQAQEKKYNEWLKSQGNEQ